MANDSEAYIVGERGPEVVAEKRSFLKDAAKGLQHVAKVIWQVPEARGIIATLLVRFGLPGTLVAIGMAVGDKLAQ